MNGPDAANSCAARTCKRSTDRDLRESRAWPAPQRFVQIVAGPEHLFVCRQWDDVDPVFLKASMVAEIRFGGLRNRDDVVCRTNPPEDVGIVVPVFCRHGFGQQKRDHVVHRLDDRYLRRIAAPGPAPPSAEYETPVLFARRRNQARPPRPLTTPPSAPVVAPDASARIGKRPPGLPWRKKWSRNPATFADVPPAPKPRAASR